jgi:hypothetical protein
MNVSFLGIGAGLVSALLVAVVAKATPLALLLFLLAPIPVLIVTLGWDHRAGLVACLAGGIATALALSPLDGLGFAAGTGLPAWWLGYLALLGQPRADGAIEWYPLGRLLAWIAATAALAWLATAFMGSGSFEAFEQRMRRLAELALRAQLPVVAGTIEGPGVELFIKRMVAVVPGIAGIGSTLILTFYLWAGAKIAAVSGRLPRPWPYIPGAIMPRPALGMLLVSIALSYLGGFIQVFAVALFGAVSMAFGLQGLAALHQLVARRRPAPALLTATYLLLVLSQGLLLLPFILFGMADTAIGIRSRMKPPPAPIAGGPTTRT